LIERFIKSKKNFYLPIVTYPPNLVLYPSFSDNRENDMYKGNYIDFISDNNDCNVDFLIFNVLALNQRIKIDIETALKYENVFITDYTLITEEMALEMFINSDINITNNINSSEVYETCVLSDYNEDSSVSLDSVFSSNSISSIELHKIKMNSGLENNCNVYCYFNAAIQMFIHDINIRNAIKMFDEKSMIDKEEPELIKYQIMDCFKQLIITTESKNYNNYNSNIKKDLVEKIRELFILKVTTRITINHQEDSNEIYNIIFSFFKNNSNLIHNNLLDDALNLYGTNVYTMKYLICKSDYCNGSNNCYLKNDVIGNIYDEIRIEQPTKEILNNYSDNKLPLPLALNYYQTTTTEIESESAYVEFCVDCSIGSSTFNHQKRIVKYPQILTISMQRFDYKNHNELIKPFMHFPLQVNLKDLELTDLDTLYNFENYLNQFDNKSVYYLSKFVQHRGDRLDSGHYLAYVLDPSCNLWYCYNDNIVTLMTPKEIEKEIEININKGLQYAFYEKDIINNNITSEGIYNLLLLFLL
jgi:hypothetical protein